MHAAQLLHCALILWTCLHKTAFAADEADCGQSGTLPVLETSAQENTNATQGAWPWMAAIRKRDKSGDYGPWCSGFLIDKRNVLSVAHCYEDKNKDVYRVGIGNINQNEADEYRITRIAVHPGYKRGFYYDNIAILTLDREVDFPNYNPVCLPDEKVRGMLLADKDATATGWGSTKIRGKIPINLQQISGISIVRNQECQRSFRQALPGNSFRRQFPQGMSKSFLCAGFIEGGKDICAGASGGPLMIKDRNRWFAVGISSFGLSCGVPGMPSGWTSVSHYLEWIRENIEVCGVSNSILPIEKTITNVTEGAWPWMVTIKSRESGSYVNWCSGFLIDRRHILSAAHCYRRRDTDYYRARIGNINQDDAEEYRITRILVPEDYTEGTFYDDIALLTLDREVNSENFSPVCLPDGEVGKMELAGGSATIAGWTRGDANVYLQQMGQLPVIDNPSCQKIFSEAVRNNFERQFPIGINKGVVCAGYMDGTKDSCEFLSGTPLMIQNKNQWYAVGILSFGFCSKRGSVVPDGYTRVSNYMDWIRENIND